MGQKSIISTIYIKDGMAVKSPEGLEAPINAVELANQFNDSGVDKIVLFDLSEVFFFTYYLIRNSLNEAFALSYK